MEVIVLGSSGAQPAAGDACSGYLVASGSSRLLLDCGSGVLSNLQRHLDLGRLTAIMISHLHADHFLDLVPLRYAVRYGEGLPPIRLYLPPGGATRLRALGLHLSTTRPFWESAFVIEEYAPGEPLTAGGLSVTPHEVEHSERSFAMRVTDGTRTLAYSADTVVCDGLRQAADGVDLLLAENTLGGGAPWHQPVNHLSAGDAGAIARCAGVGSLALTHFWPSADREQCRREAAECYDGEITLAAPNRLLTV